MAKIVFDTELCRPACALLQAAMGGDRHMASLFPVESWLIAPTSAMRCFKINDDQLGILVTRVREGAACSKAQPTPVSTSSSRKANGNEQG
jgi:hypothetical protein